MGKEINVKYSIASATITSSGGIMQIAITGEDKDIEKAIKFLNNNNVTITEIDNFIPDV